MPHAVSFSSLRMERRCVVQPTASSGTAASPIAQLRLVAEPHVQEDERPDQAKRRDEKGLARERPRTGPGLDDGQPVAQDVNVVRGVAVEAALPDGPGLGARVRGAGFGADPVDGREPRSGQGLSGDRELGAGDVHARRMHDLAEAHHRTHQGVQVGDRSGAARLGDPADDGVGLLEGRSHRTEGAEPGRRPGPRQNAGAPGRPGRARGGLLRRPHGRRGARHRRTGTPRASGEPDMDLRAARRHRAARHRGTTRRAGRGGPPRGRALRPRSSGCRRNPGRRAARRIPTQASPSQPMGSLRQRQCARLTSTRARRRGGSSPPGSRGRRPLRSRGRAAPG